MVFIFQLQTSMFSENNDQTLSPFASKHSSGLAIRKSDFSSLVPT